MRIASLRIVWYIYYNVRVKSNCSRSVYPMGSKAQWITQAVASWTWSKAGMLWQSESLPLCLN
jgi:hypothetical protein